MKVLGHSERIDRMMKRGGKIFLFVAAWLALTGVARAQAAPALPVTWLEDFDHSCRQCELRALPKLTVEREERGKVFVRVENTTGIRLRYVHTMSGQPQAFIKQKVAGQWVPTIWDWCGTGMREVILEPAESVVFPLEVVEGPYQWFTRFSNAEDRNEYSAVKLHERQQGSF